MLQDLGALQHHHRRLLTEAPLSTAMKNASRKDLRNLADQRLLTVQPGPRGQMTAMCFDQIRKELRSPLRASTRHKSLYSGIVKKRELRHDAAIYEVYQKEAQKISKSGGHRKASCARFRIEEASQSPARTKSRIFPLQSGNASGRKSLKQHGLKIVEGKIQIPGPSHRIQSPRIRSNARWISNA